MGALPWIGLSVASVVCMVLIGLSWCVVLPLWSQLTHRLLLACPTGRMRVRHHGRVTYQPDAQDEIIGDAEAVGGAVFVDELHYVATAAAEAICPWDGTGTEPPLRVAVWMHAARRLVAARRAELFKQTPG